MDLQTLARVEASLDASQYVRGAQQVEQSTERVEQATTRGAQSFERLERQLDRARDGQARFEQAQAGINRALERGLVTSTRANELNELARQRFLGVAEAADRAGSRTSRLGPIMQQAGFQVGDFASQIASGGNAMTAFIQQGSQLAGFFGPVGAVAGAVGGIIGILAMHFLRASEGADALAASQQALQRSLQQSISFFETAAERAARLDQEQRNAIASGFALRQGAAQTQLAQAQTALATLERDRAETIERNRFIPGFNPDTVLAGPISQQQRTIEALQFEISALREQRGNALTAPSGAQRDAAARAAAPAAAGRAPSVPRDTPGLRDQWTRDFETGMDSMRRQVETPRERYARTLSELGEFVARADAIGQQVPDDLISRVVDRTNAELERAESGISSLGNATRDFGLTFSSAFEDAVIRGRDLSSVLEGLAQDFARIALRRGVVDPLVGALFGTSGQGGGAATPGLLSGIGTSIAGAFGFGGARAEGGPVWPGQAFLVGERGPELLVPRGAGTVIPNEALRGGGPTIVVNVDARGADAATEARLRAQMPEIARAAVEQAVARSPSFARRIRGA